MQASTLATTAATEAATAETRTFYRVPFPLSAQRFISFLCSWDKTRERWREKLTYWVFKGWMPGKVLPCSERDCNLVTFAENKEHDVPFEIHMYRQSESALWWMRKCSAEWLPGPGSKCLSLFCTFLLTFFCLFWLFLITFFIFFLHSSLKYLDSLQVFLSMRSHVIWNMGCSGPVADITVHWTLGSFSAFSSPLWRRSGLGDPQVSCQTLRVCMSSWTPGLWR